MKVGVKDRDKDEAHHHVACDALCRTCALDRCLLVALDVMDTDKGDKGDADIALKLELLVADATRWQREMEPVILGMSLACGVEVDVLSQELVKRAEAATAARAQLMQLLCDPGITQRTPAWYEARADMITASDVAQALGAGKFGTQRAFFQKKCGAVDEQTPFDATLPPLKWGVIYEPVAQALYSAFNRNLRVHEFGLLRHPEVPFIGASPDGISDLGVMLEIKCPWRRSIVPGEVPMQYYYQIQAQLAVTGLSECDYFECEFAEPTDEAEWLAASLSYDACGVFVELFPSGVDNNSISSNRVTYDDAFVADMFARLAVVWERVMHYRTDRDSYLAEVGAATSPPIPSSLAAHQQQSDLTKFAFVDDDVYSTVPLCSK